MKIFLFCSMLVIGVAVVSCSKKKEYSQTETQTEEVAVAQNDDGKIQWQAPQKADVDGTKKYFALIKTSKGDIKVELFAKDAPLSVTNFVQLAQKKFYKGLTFHRVESDFVIQAGDPTATGSGDSGYTMPAEIKLNHTAGAVAWARLPDTDGMGKPLNPEKRSSGSQFYITLAPQPFLDGGYTVFGQTVEGLEVAKKIQRGDTITDIEIQIQ